MWEHCRLWSFGDYMPQEDSNTILAGLLFGRMPPNVERFLEAHTALIKRVASAARDDPLADIANSIAVARKHVDAEERRFVTHFKTTAEPILRSAEARNRSGEDIARLRNQVEEFLSGDTAINELARAQVLETARTLDIILTEAEIEDRTDALSAACKTSLELIKEIGRKVILTEIKIEKPERRNWVWDYDVAFSINKADLVDAGAAVLVTGDRDIHLAAERAGEANRVMTLDQYERWLNQTD